MQFCKDLLEFQRKISIKHLLIFQNVLLICALDYHFCFSESEKSLPNVQTSDYK